jgi:hypothetical protein
MVPQNGAVTVSAATTVSFTRTRKLHRAVVPVESVAV